jgi:FkbM family methyltransferase
MKNIYIQIGAGAGDLDSRVNFRDGFSELVKSLDPSTVERIILVEPNPINIPKLKECWKDYPQVEIHELGICLKSSTEKSITFYYVEEDAPHFQVFSMKPEHVRYHYPTEEIKSKIVECTTLEDFLNDTIGEGTVVEVLALDIEGIDAEVVLENDWNKINCKYLSVEHLHLREKAQSVVEKLTGAGYQPNGNGIDPHGYDWSFIKKFD